VGVLIVIGVLALVIIAALAFIATRPAKYRIERSAQIDARPDVVFSIINDLRRWDEWSPYDKRDPNMEKTFEGPSSGPGASYCWNGNNQVGEGRLTIVESKPGELISMKLEFSRPFQCANEVNFNLEPSESGTRVRWIMDGRNNFLTKAMSVCGQMDKMMGKDFDEGLANLNHVAQAAIVTAREGKPTRVATP
jgi:uncharacterized protein YndB with AHSA1/START domain